MRNRDADRRAALDEDRQHIAAQGQRGQDNVSEAPGAEPGEQGAEERTAGNADAARR